ncbi:phosphatase PAP2 family protein [Limosilactobacillus equigenerosi]|uniref:Phosphatidic acid phosphatase type 2/haloperoxidase domain-containing protein n=1 Tax=Limosilactobacillus equigenerosi DSM 18793 = JCM 14505 TaxID=1423742 RepID=A0A0R1UML9_9LACO|nr:phosphatase PAP2 family protein [Limosilactobacillus equigenerosi]KRL92611.1 hypothetical protein FC21_GL000204 [Limosilactobacillus equigenerosi DSM 18793 = JCM 14505]
MILIWLWSGLILLVGMLKLGWWQPIDQWGYRHLPDRRLSKFWRLVAVVGQPLVDVLIVILMAGWLYQQGQPLPTLWVLLVLGSADLVGLAIKHYFPRARPQKHLPYDDDASFPSGHVLGATLLTLLTWSVWPSWWTLGMAGVYWLLVTWSRLILRAHHLSDVIVTLWLAITWFTTWYWLW